MLIRDLPAEDLDQIRAKAAAQGRSLQSYLLDALHAQAVYLRRQAALERTADRLRGHAGVPETEREAVLAAVDDAHGRRAEQTSDRAEG